MAVVIGVYAGDYVADGRRGPVFRPGQEKPIASVRANIPMKAAKRFAAMLQEEAGGQSANVIFEALPWKTAKARYTLTA